MRILGALILCLVGALAQAADWEDRQIFNPTAPGAPLRILSSTDTALFAPIVQSYLAGNPDTSIEYLVTGTADIDRRFREAPERFDIVISSAMDLQLKLVNDGFARRLRGVSHPDWAHWRESLFAFTSEPAAIVINKAAFAGQPIPATRQELIEAMRARPEVFEGRIGTYDVRSSGLGYLFATQDARTTETFWRLMEVMGRLGVRLYCCSGEMIDDLTTGQIVVAYNVLGSYARARPESGETLEIIMPSDFPTTMMRTALVSDLSPSAETAQSFIEHLIAVQSGPDPTALPSLGSPQSGADTTAIALEPALLTFLDALKRRKFLSEWEDALIQK